MRLLSLTVRNYRVHKELSIDFDPSRTLIGGPNESGKSTLAEAAHRALFLRSRTGGAVQKEMVSELHSGHPEVELSFEIDGKRWELKKTFAGPRGSTLLTSPEGRSLQGDEAEARLLELLKMEEAGGNVSASRLPTLWSHLWVWQGKAIEDPATSSAAHKDQLIQHLQSQGGVAAVLQSSNDQRVAARIAEAYDALFTTTGRVKANSKLDLAKTRLDASVIALEKAEEAAQRLAQSAETYLQAEREIRESKEALPQLRNELEVTAEKLEQVSKLRRDEESHRETHAQVTARFNELVGHDETIRKLQTKLSSQTAALQPAEEALVRLTQSAEEARRRSREAETRQAEANEALHQARLHHDFARAAVTANEKAAAHQRLSTRSQDAAEIQEKLANQRRELAKLPTLSASELTQLRQLESAVHKTSATLEAMATGVTLVKSSEVVQLDGETLQPGQTRILTADGELNLGEDTLLRIQPGGGTSLATARSNATNARESLASALATHTLRDLDHANHVWEQRQTITQGIESLEARWNTLGGEALVRELAEASAAHEAAQEELKRRREAIGTQAATEDLSEAHTLLASTQTALSDAEAAEASARREAALLRDKLQESSEALSRHSEATAAVRQEQLNLQSAITAREEAHGDERQRREAIEDARARVTQATVTLSATREALAALDPEQLTNDQARFTRSIHLVEDRLSLAEKDRLIALDRLTLDGSVDPEAELSQARANHHAAEEQYQAEFRRAEAIKRLHELFAESSAAIDAALVQPLAERISDYLELLFGRGTKARVTLSESGIGSLELLRPDHTSFAFASLSGGAREQTAAAVRLAVAEILAADHGGTLPIVFDDAFAYSDADRIQSLQRMLDLAAHRGLQVVVLTCSPKDYSALGAAERRLGLVSR